MNKIKVRLTLREQALDFSILGLKVLSGTAALAATAFKPPIPVLS